MTREARSILNQCRAYATVQATSRPVTDHQEVEAHGAEEDAEPAKHSQRKDTHTHARTHTRTRTHTHMHIRTRTHRWAVRACKHTHVHTHTHTRARTFGITQNAMARLAPPSAGTEHEWPGGWWSVLKYSSVSRFTREAVRGCERGNGLTWVQWVLEQREG